MGTIYFNKDALFFVALENSETISAFGIFVEEKRVVQFAESHYTRCAFTNSESPCMTLR